MAPALWPRWPLCRGQRIPKGQLDGSGSWRRATGEWDCGIGVKPDELHGLCGYFFWCLALCGSEVRLLQQTVVYFNHRCMVFRSNTSTHSLGKPLFQFHHSASLTKVENECEWEGDGIDNTLNKEFYATEKCKSKHWHVVTWLVVIYLSGIKFGFHTYR